MRASFSKKSIGAMESAKRCLRKAAAEVKAYQQFLRDRQAGESRELHAFPLTDKQCYLMRYPFADLLAGEWEETFAVFSSSGSSGHPFYWPQLKSAHRASSARLRHFLEAVFAVHERRTLAIVGLALGSWIGGDHFSWVLKDMAIEVPYGFAVFSPGNRHAEIIEIIRQAECFVDQIILFVCPSAIGHLRLLAEEEGQALPLSKLRYIVLGEPFPENLRSSLEHSAGLTPSASVMFSIYGSADTGVLGFESPASVLLRKLCQQQQGVAEALGVPSTIPTFFHLADPEAFLEEVDGELCVTKWQGIPLLRYNLHDRVQLFEWKAICEALGQIGSPSLPPELSRTFLSAALAELPDLLAILGRADRCLILCGTNLTEYMLDEAVRAPELQPYLTGLYRARIGFARERQHLELLLEFKGGIQVSEQTLDEVYRRLVVTLGRAQPEFADDWNNVYSRWDDDPAHRILQLQGVSWPTLSHETESSIKQRGIVA